MIRGESNESSRDDSRPTSVLALVLVVGILESAKSVI